MGLSFLHLLCLSFIFFVFPSSSLSFLHLLCLSFIFFVFPFIGIFLLHCIVNIESFPQITRFDPVTEFNQDRLPHFSHSDQLLSHVPWVRIDDLIMVNFDQIGTGCAILTYNDANKCGCSFLYSNKPCTSSHDRCILQVEMVDWV